MKNKELIGLVSDLVTLRPGTPNGNDITVRVARTETHEGKTTPRNWSFDWEEPKTSTGGCYCRIFASQWENDPVKILFGWYGPGISWGNDIREYKHGVRAMERIGKALDKIYQTRGSTTDAVDMVGRFLEAAGVSKIYVRPDGQNQGWHNRGEWDVLTIGMALSRIRQCCPKPGQA